MPQARQTQQQRREQAKTQVLTSAIAIFAEYGYQLSHLQAIAEHSGLTIRPIYHYFKNKEGLFLAATEQLENELSQAIQHLFEQNLAPMAIWQCFISFAKRQDFRQIVLIDAPTVLGRKRWQESLVINTVSQYLDQQNIQQQMALQMLIASLAEAALLIAEQPDNPATIDSANSLVERLINALLNA